MARITQIQVRRDTAANWVSQNPTLAAGEHGFETDTGKFKIGTGSAAWNSLTYAADASKISGTTLSTSVTTATGITSVGTLGSLSVTGTTTSGSFSGSGAGITALNAGNISSGTLAIANGGTNATTAALARTSLGVAASGANADITSITGLTTMLSPAQGGTGVNNSSANTITVSGGPATLQSQTNVSATYVPVLYYSNAADIVTYSNATPTTADQLMFGKSVGLAADTAYEFEAEWYISLTQGSTNGGFVFTVGYTGTLSTNGTGNTGLAYHGNMFHGSQNTATGVNNSASTFFTYATTATNISSWGGTVTAATTYAFDRVTVKGVIRTQTSGNFSLKLRTSGNGVTAFQTSANSWLRLTPLGPAGSSGTAVPVVIGTWV